MSSGNAPAPIPGRNDSIKRFDDSSSSALHVEWTDANKNKACEEQTTCDDSSRSLHVEWPEQDDPSANARDATHMASGKHLAVHAPTNRKSSMDAAVTTASTVAANSKSSRRLAHADNKMKKSSLSRTASSISLGLKREMEHTEQSTSSNRSLGSISGFLRRNASAGEICTSTSTNTNMSRRGKRMSELTSNSNWDIDDGDDDDKSVNLEDMNSPGGASGSSRSIFNKFIDRVKEASSSNLSTMSDFLAEEVGQNKHRSTYLKDRASIKVRRASDFLYSSHHKQGADDGKSLGTSSSHREHATCTCNRTGNRLHDDDCGIHAHVDGKEKNSQDW